MSSSRPMLLQWVALICAAHTARGTVQIIGEVSFDLRVANQDEHDDGDEIQKKLHNFKSRLQSTESLQLDSVELKQMETRRDSDIGVSDIDDTGANDTSAIDSGNNNRSDSPDIYNADSYVKNITAAPQASCDYQFPERRQTNAMLSNMMNQLTKVSGCRVEF